MLQGHRGVEPRCSAHGMQSKVSCNELGRSGTWPHDRGRCSLCLSQAKARVGCAKVQLMVCIKEKGRTG